MFRASRWKVSDRWVDSRRRYIFSFWISRLNPVVHSSAKPMQMNSSMTFIQSNGCKEIDLIFKLWWRYIWRHVSFGINHLLFKAYMSSYIPPPYLLISNLSLCVHYSVWKAWLISVVRVSSICEQRNASEKFKVKIYASTRNQTSYPLAFQRGASNESATLTVKAGPLRLKQLTSTTKIRILSQTSVLYLIR